MRLILPEAPSINRCIDLAKSGVWGQAYYGTQQAWREQARLFLPPAPPDAPWERWSIEAVHFRLWNRRDPLELYVALKWAADLLVDEGWMIDDGPDFLIHVPQPTQEIARKGRGVTLDIRNDGDLNRLRDPLDSRDQRGRRASLRRRP